jgi:hypothetical protein
VKGFDLDLLKPTPKNLQPDSGKKFGREDSFDSESHGSSLLENELGGGITPERSGKKKRGMRSRGMKNK